jgi:2-octaprenyl-6-methoxyphenol hydroxylase
MTPSHVDIAIVGGGPVGAALALGLADSGLTVALLEARTELDAGDPRAIALSQGSRLILERLGGWTGLAHRATAIETIHVSQAGGFGRALISAAEARVPALGYTVRYGDLHAALAGGLGSSGTSLIAGARVTAVRPLAGCGLVEYRRGGLDWSLSARLIVLADGGRSLPVADKTVKDYGQSAVVCTVATSRPQGRRAYERFTPQGPIALLPLGERYALVWTTPSDQVEDRLGLSDADFLTQLQSAFGERQGTFVASGPRSAFPLRLVTTRQRERPGLALIGNAAQTLHPVAGQGFNLGLRDAWTLARTILDTRREALGSERFLARYRAARRWDVAGGIAMTDLLVDLFSNDLPVLREARGLALSAMDAMAPVKTLFVRKMMFGAQAW